jgi:hypothetical protein
MVCLNYGWIIIYLSTHTLLVADKSVGSCGSLSLLFRDEGDDFILCKQFSQGYDCTQSVDVENSL